MAKIFVSHSSKDSAVALDLAQELGQHGFSSWYYERHSLPGISYETQVRSAIEDSSVFLIVISDNSLRSSDVSEELKHAQLCRKEILPVRLKISDLEFRRRQKAWDAIVGTRVTQELSHEGLSTLTRQLTESLQKMGIDQDLPRQGDTSMTIPQPSLKVSKGSPWASDASQIRIDDMEEIVFSNELVMQFLRGKGKYFVSANKGLGKTLLLTYKRALVQAENVNGPGGRGAIIVPSGHPYIDLMSGDLGSIGKKRQSYLENLTGSKTLWSFALKIAALSCHPSLFFPADEEDLLRLPKKVRSWLGGALVEPTVVFKEMLDLSRSDMLSTIDRTHNFLDQKYRCIHGSTFFFIDKVDQACGNLSRDAWISVQAGLIEAAWDLLNANNHVKIYASIRQEAFAHYESDIKSNLYGATTVLHYSRDELAQLLDQLTRCYEAKSDFHDFLGLNVVKHSTRAFPEDSFEYLRRHTLGRPRDFVIIASKFAERPNRVSQSAFCEVVNRTASEVLVSNVFTEMRVFLSCLADRHDRLRFLALLPSNILTRHEAIGVWCSFNGIERAKFDEDFYRDSDSYHHPFWELYTAGLLGVVREKNDGSTAVQVFKQPLDQVGQYTQSALPDATEYVIHPALGELVRNNRMSGVYNVFQNVIVGHNCPWERHYNSMCDVERYLFSVEAGPMKSLANSLLKDISVLLSSGRSHELRGAVERSSRWSMLQSMLQGNEHNELGLWLEELILAGSAGAVEMV